MAGAILVGGKASRYGGVQKALLDAGGGTAIVHGIIHEMTRAGLEEILILARDDRTCGDLGREVVMDLRSDGGPLAGIEAAITHLAGRCRALLLCPCDLPGITHRQFTALINAFHATAAPVVVAETGDFFWHPLCAVVHIDVFPAVAAALDHAKGGVATLWRDLGAEAVHFDDPTPLFNVNTPEDLANWRRRDDP